jgi:protease-4
MTMSWFKRNRSSDVPPYSPDDSIEVLQERQRLMQIHTFDKWVSGTVKQSRSRHRWTLIFKGMLLLIVLLSAFNTWYFLRLFDESSEVADGASHVGIVDVTGPIDAQQPANADRINSGLRQAMENPNTVAVAIRINSPGGSPVQSKRVYDEIRYESQRHPDKPIYAVIEDIGASGAYYIASATKEIYASPTAIVGSIGVISTGFGFDKTIKLFDVERRVYTAGTSKSMLDPFSPAKDEQVEYWKTVLGATHQKFIADVKQGRGDRLKPTEGMFEGLVWEAGTAKNIGIIDDQLTLEQLVRKLVPDDDGKLKVKNYTPRLSPFADFKKGISLSFQEALGIGTSEGYSSPVRAMLP